jgi:hypothetical protein
MSQAHVAWGTRTSRSVPLYAPSFVTEPLPDRLPRLEFELVRTWLLQTLTLPLCPGCSTGGKVQGGRQGGECRSTRAKTVIKGGGE